MNLCCDLHIHSCLSPCGDLSMSPSKIARVLSNRGVHIAALTDHNTSLNCPAFDAVCRSHGIIPLFGMEAQTSEEIHALCLFGVLDDALQFSRFVYDLLPDIHNNPEKTGDQVYVDENEDILGEVDKYLITSLPLSLKETADWVHQAGGLFIPAHVDRPAFSMTSQLGFVVDGPWDALEVVKMPGAGAAGSEVNTLGYPLTQSSDAHYPEHIARRSFVLNLPVDIGELRKMPGTEQLHVIRGGILKLPG